MSDGVRDLVRPEVRRIRAYSVPVPEGIRVKLDANEVTHVLPESIRSTLGELLASVDLNRYPDSRCGELRSLLSEELAVAPECLLFGNGSDELLQILLSAFAAPRRGCADASVLYPTPSFEFYRLATVSAGLRPVEVPLGPGFELELDATRRALARFRPNLCLLARPNNPTGTLWPAAQVLELAREHPDVLFVSDEAYHAYAGDSVVDAAWSEPNLIVLRTLSKIGLAGLRVGYLVATAELVGELNKVRSPYNVSSLSQTAAAYLLRHHREWFRQCVDDVLAERARIAAALASAQGIEVFESAANLVLFRVGEADGRAAGAIWQMLVDRGILIRQFSVNGPLAGCLRVTVGTREENDQFLAAMAECVARAVDRSP